jgi:SpoVK/Ycf46/Vps4 family AAA+-type ATPase
MNATDVFEASLDYPDPEARRRLALLTGIDDQRERLEKGLILTIDRDAIERWSRASHGSRLPLVAHFLARPPLFLLAGDVGTGKTALAETIGDAVARRADLPVTLHRMSLGSRGSGLVGEMTGLVTRAFSQIVETARKSVDKNGKARAGHILLIDEADALAQSRSTDQMHHEDRAGVNALIRGINLLAEAKLPIAVLMCTNRVGAIDPAVLRRAAEVLEFGRPGDERRKGVIVAGLDGVGFDEKQVEQLVEATGPRDGGPGFTYSDLTQRLLPGFALDAFPDSRITFKRALERALATRPTPEFKEDGR